MNDKPNTPPGWNLLGPGNKGTPTDKAAEQPAPMSAEAPLSGEWRASQFYVCCGTLRIFRIDIDTDPSAEFTDSLMRWVVERLNASEQAAEIAVLRHDLADERRRWPECDNHRTGEPDARRGHCAQCGVEREKSKDAEIRRLKSLAKEIANDLTDDAVSLNAARKDLAAAQATIAEMREELIRARANSETLKRMMADTVGIAAMKDRIAALEADLAQECQRSQQMYDAGKNAMRADRDAARAEVAKLREEVGRLKQELAKANQRADADRERMIESWRKQRSEWQEREWDHIAIARELKAQLASARIPKRTDTARQRGELLALVKDIQGCPKVMAILERYATGIHDRIAATGGVEIATGHGIMCPACNHDVSESHFACHSGAEGGKKSGPTKARTSEQASAAAKARWDKARSEKANAEK